MAQKIYVDKIGKNIYVAITENGALVEFLVEKETGVSAVGNIYKGKVENVLKGMQAAFVDIGQKKNAFLSSSDLLFDKGDLEKDEVPSILSIVSGSDILVQVVVDALGNKGARVTNLLTFAGRYLVYLPNVDVCGISKKILSEKSREKLTKSLEKIKCEGEGFIVRTAGENASRTELKKEATYLKKLYSDCLDKFNSSSSPSTIFCESNLAYRVFRDKFNAQTDTVIVGDKGLYSYLRDIALKRKTGEDGRVELYQGSVPLFKKYNLLDELEKSLKNKVVLSNGANIVINKTEALTSIDVNTGRFKGGKNLEETAFETNLLASKEIARQVKLRNIGGIVVVDFIDMEDETHKNEVVSLLSSELSKDKTKSTMHGMTELNLVLFTRKRTRAETHQLLMQPCAHCNGEGEVLSSSYMAFKLTCELGEVLSKGYKNALVELSPSFMGELIKTELFTQEQILKMDKVRVYLLPSDEIGEQEFKVTGNNQKVLSLPDDAKLLF